MKSTDDNHTFTVNKMVAGGLGLYIYTLDVCINKTLEARIPTMFVGHLLKLTRGGSDCLSD